MGEDQSQNTLQRLTGLREQLEKQEQTQQTPITVRHYHCDHLGTPLALTDQNQQIVWAAKLDPWGNVEQEFNAHNIDQAIRLPGQHHDKETGLYYNRHRYYDPSIGSYVNQDPIGLIGGVNKSIYVSNAIQLIDPLGLVACNPQQNERCKALKKQIFNKSTLLIAELGKYDPIQDGQGGHSMKWGSGQTKPGGHFTEISQLQRGLKNDISEYVKDCQGKDRCDDDGGKWESIPRSIDEAANRPVPPPVDSSGNPIKMAGAAVGAGILAYGAYRLIRFLPSLYPPLWGTIPANLATP